MFRFGLKNMRRLKKVDPIEILPITVLVGRNSSGKSTFLRTFPLIRQSIMTRTSSPILWYGDLVDFGEFGDVVHDNNSEKRISFLFGIDNVSIEPSYYNFEEGFFLEAQALNCGSVDIELLVAGAERRTKLDGFVLKFRNTGSVFSVEIDESGKITTVRRNGATVTGWFDGYTLTAQLGALFPSIAVRRQDAESSPHFPEPAHSPVSRHLAEILQTHLDKRLRQDQLTKLAYEILRLNEFSSSALKALADRTSSRTFKKFLSNLVGKEKTNLFQTMFAIYEVNIFIRA